MSVAMLAAADIPSFSQTWNDLVSSMDLARHPDEILNFASTLPMIGAVIVTAVGAACVFQGYKWHKAIVVVLALMLGFGVGRLISAEVGKSTVVAVALGILLAAIASPLLKYTVAFFGGIAGGMETRRRGDARRGDGSTLVRVRLARRSFESEGDSIQK